MKRWPAILFHLIPIVPIALNYRFAAVAAVLLVAVAYIKVFKLREQREELRVRKLPSDRELDKALRLWETLTFVKPQRS